MKRDPSDVEAAVWAERGGWEDAIFQAAELANVSRHGLSAGQVLKTMAEKAAAADAEQPDSLKQGSPLSG